MALTSTRQRNAVSEGMALGLVMCNRFTLPWDKVGVDLSFVPGGHGNTSIASHKSTPTSATDSTASGR